jgi:hypothetical protein
MPRPVELPTLWEWTTQTSGLHLHSVGETEGYSVELTRVIRLRLRRGEPARYIGATWSGSPRRDGGARCGHPEDAPPVFSRKQLEFLCGKSGCERPGHGFLARLTG